MGKHPYIFLVEDTRQDELLTVRALKKSRIADDIIVTRDGAEALDFLFSRGRFEEEPSRALPQVVLLDLKLPKLSGLDVLKEIRNSEKTRFLPVVMLSTSIEDSDLHACYESGANSYVRKPIDSGEFEETVKNLGQYWLSLNESAIHV